MRVVITAATAGEWMPSFQQISSLYTGESNRFKVSFHQSGVGMLASSVALTRLAIEEKPDLIIQAGIAGCFDNNAALGKVVVVKDDMAADIGVAEDGKWKDIFDLKLEKPNNAPHQKKKLPNHFLDRYNLLKLPEVSAITINEITTSPQRTQQLVKKYNPFIESMEGAALHYVGRTFNIPFIQIRATSNYIGERNKANWKIKESIGNLNQALLKYIDKLYKTA